MTIGERLREVLARDAELPAEPLTDRVNALCDYLGATHDIVPDELLAPARFATSHAQQRLGLSGAHTAVALAGATGSGKSSLFNSLVRIDVSPVGIRRPTTALPYACVWGTEGARRLLDWLGIPIDRRFIRESALDGDDEAPLRGLILLDLPDFDSIAVAHRDEVDRVLALVDLIVWVVDPQKYGDQVIHERYLREFRDYRDITVVALNQADRLSATDLGRCLADLRKLLDNDGLHDVPVIATSAREDPPGHADLRKALEAAVAARAAARQRLGTDVDGAVQALSATVGPPVADHPIDRDEVQRLGVAISTSAGLPGVVDAGARSYRHRATRLTGWPFSRLLRRLRPDPLRRLRTSDATAARRAPKPVRGSEAEQPDRNTPQSTAQQASIALAIRSVADRATTGLPAPWPTAAYTAGRAVLADLPEALDRAVARTDLGVRRNRRWWRLVWLVQWLCAHAIFAAVGWLLVSVVVDRLNRTMPKLPDIFGFPLPVVVIVAGIVIGLLLTLIVQPFVRAGTRQAKAVMEQRLYGAIDQVAEERVAVPMRGVLDRYSRAREALLAAGHLTARG